MELYKKNHKKLAVFSVLALISILFANVFEPYRVVGPELLVNHDFRQELSGWEQSGPTGLVKYEHPQTVHILSNRPELFIGLSQKIENPERFKYLSLSGEVRTENVTSGNKGWNKARLIMSSHDQHGRWLPAPHHVILLTGTNSWHPYGNVFEVHKDASEVRVTAQLPKATGSLWVKNMSVRQAVPRVSAKFFLISGIAIWSIFLLSLLLPYFRRARNGILQIAVCTVVVSLLAGTLLPSDINTQLRKESVNILHNVKHYSLQETQPGSVQQRLKHDLPVRKILRIQKIGHFSLFVLLSLLLAVAYPKVSKWQLLIDVTILAAATELMQIFIESRTPLLDDLLLDSSGALLGLGIIWLSQRWGAPLKIENRL